MTLSETPTRVLFVGPSYAPLAATGLAGRAGFALRPPAKRGDFAALLDQPPGIAVLVDGNFQESVAVGHVELRRVLRAGWTVWGLSSLGAIRAFEMRALGMRGFGRVFSHFLAGDDFQDDEVALLHSAEDPFVPASEPLVHLRYAVAELERRGAIASKQAELVVADLKNRWFGFRSLDTFIEVVDKHCGVHAREVAATLLADFDEFRIKTKDLESFLERGTAWSETTTAVRAPYFDA